MNLMLIFIALAPPLGLLWFFYVSGPAFHLSHRLTGLLFVSGMISGGPALVLNHMMEKYTLLWPGAPETVHRVLFWLVGIGLNEEFSKLLPLLALLFFRKDFKTPYQGLLGGVSVALGFSAIENLFYLERFGTVTLLIRSVLTVPAHAFFTAPLGVALAYAKHAGNAWGAYGWLLGGLLVSVGFHGLYDVWLSLESEWLNQVAYGQVVLMGVLTLFLMRLRLPENRRTEHRLPPEPIQTETP